MGATKQNKNKGQYDWHHSPENVIESYEPYCEFETGRCSIPLAPGVPGGSCAGVIVSDDDGGGVVAEDDSGSGNKGIIMGMKYRWK